ncbi:hypothetical protein COBT_001137 [Conglomerata obtusa]
MLCINVKYISTTDFQYNKLGGLGKVVQIDETMLNYKAKSHRGRSPNNKTNSLCIEEVDLKITRVYATVIHDKKSFNLNTDNMLSSLQYIVSFGPMSTGHELT